MESTNLKEGNRAALGCARAELPDLAAFRTTRFTAKLWITPENEIVPLTTWHYLFFSDPSMAKRYGVEFGPEIPTRLNALKVGFIRLNHSFNGGLLTIESMRWDRKLGDLIHRLILRNADEIDAVKLNLVGTNGELTRSVCVSLMNQRALGSAINLEALSA